ncbi:hypothetical protein BHE74_00035431 [Ensete ventricosum]|nr:hypothetical protein BHE74_00035431 [Ensete ventricosum]
MAANKLYVAAVLIQLAYAGFHVISKAAFDKGMSTMESIKMRSLSGICKAVGVTICLAGVVTIALYRGPHIHPFNLLPHHGRSTSNQDHSLAHSKATWIKGSFFMIIANLTWSLWLVLQSLFSTFQSLFVAMAFERDSSKWKLHLDMGLLAILYCVSILTMQNLYLI